MPSKCKGENCSKQASFNFQGEKTALYCSHCKLEGMVNVAHKKCATKDCTKQPNFNFQGEKKGIYCSHCKLEGMVNVINKKCATKDCTKIPYFNFQGEKGGIYCSHCKLEGMVDVKSRKCASKNCTKKPSYNFKGEKRPLYCGDCKKNDMVNVKNKKCATKNCTKIPIYNFLGEKTALYCGDCKKINMVNIISKRCKSGYCTGTFVQNNKYDGYCLRCYMFIHPDKSVSRNYKTKEFATVEYIQNKFPNFDWVADKTVFDGCSRKRPDLVCDLGYQVLIIEVDENQHTDYDCSCENKRLMELSQDFGHRPLIFIRFNPDKYIANGKIITSCWGINKRGICTVKKNKKTEWVKRLKTLEDQVCYWTTEENNTNKTVTIIQLFYDV